MGCRFLSSESSRGAWWWRWARPQRKPQSVERVTSMHTWQTQCEHGNESVGKCDELLTGPWLQNRNLKKMVVVVTVIVSIPNRRSLENGHDGLSARTHAHVSGGFTVQKLGGRFVIQLMMIFECSDLSKILSFLHFDNRDSDIRWFTYMWDLFTVNSS